MKRIVKFAVITIIFLALAEVVWLWGFCRFYVGPNQMAIVTAKNGDPLERIRFWPARAKKEYGKNHSAKDVTF